MRKPFLKRPLDICLALTGLVVWAPIWLVIVAAIWFEDGRPILFRLRLPGRDDKEFWQLKFRSMRRPPPGDNHAMVFLENDPRVTRVGRLLRRLALDELPQLINILRGEMSFVGPRPVHWDEGKPKYATVAKIRGYEERRRIRPGLTGISQLYLDKYVGPERKFRYDGVYLDRMSMLLDLKIIALSVWVSLGGGWERRGRRLGRRTRAQSPRRSFRVAEFANDLNHYYLEWWENPKDPRNVVFSRLNSLVRRRIPSGTGRRALDLGAGRGKITGYLVEKGYTVTAVEINPEFSARLRARFPAVSVVEADVRALRLAGVYDVATAIELSQNMSLVELGGLLETLAATVRYLCINVSNPNSLHGRWVEWRRFRNSFVEMHTVEGLERSLAAAGFVPVYRRGVGVVTPITLLQGFRGVLIPPGVAGVFNRILDRIAPRHCHLYYIEARSTRCS